MEALRLTLILVGPLLFAPAEAADTQDGEPGATLAVSAGSVTRTPDGPIAAYPPMPSLRSLPSTGYLQLARAPRASGVGAGLAWTGAPIDCLEPGDQCSTRIDVELARWRPYASAGPERSSVTQLGITPLLRQRLARTGDRAWFAEIGIGVNLVRPLYRNGNKRFSTALNFGSQFAVGLAFGQRLVDEVSLRIEHFSNAGIDAPNPGENFLQLRWLHRY
jgi:hypothetical protein